MRQKSTDRYLQTRGVCSRSLQKDSSKTFTNPLRSLLRGRNHQHGRRHEQPSRRIEYIYKNYTARRRTSSLKGVPSFGPASASTTNPPSTSSKGKDDRRRLTVIRPLPLRCGMPPTYCYVQRVAQPSLLYGDSRARHPRTGQDMGS